jgi:hypothetical protein
MSKAATARRYHPSERIACPDCGTNALAPLLTPTGTDSTKGYCFVCSTSVGFPKGIATAEIPQSERAQNLLEWHGKTTSESLRHRNGLSTYLVDRYGDAARAVLEAWDVGTDGQGNCVFWYRDETGHLATAKVVPYDSSTGKRRKRDLSPITWTIDGKQVRVDCLFGLVKGTNKETQEAVVVSFSSRKGYAAPLYGAQFLTADTVDRPVVLVESEKTAIVGSLFLQELLFVATGGANGLTRDKAQPLAGRDVLVLLDMDDAGRRSEAAVVELLESVGARPVVEIDGASLASVLMPNAADGADLADYYLSSDLEVVPCDDATTIEAVKDERFVDVATTEIPQSMFSEFTSPTVSQVVAFSPRVFEEIPTKKLQDKEYVRSLMLRAFKRDRKLRREVLQQRIVELVGREQSSDVYTRADSHRLFRKQLDWSQIATTGQCIETLTLERGGAK